MPPYADFLAEFRENQVLKILTKSAAKFVFHKPSVHIYNIVQVVLLFKIYKTFCSCYSWNIPHTWLLLGSQQYFGDIVVIRCGQYPARRPNSFYRLSSSSSIWNRLSCQRIPAFLILCHWSLLTLRLGTQTDVVIREAYLFSADSGYHAQSYQLLPHFYSLMLLLFWTLVTISLYRSLVNYKRLLYAIYHSARFLFYRLRFSAASVDLSFFEHCHFSKLETLF